MRGRIEYVDADIALGKLLNSVSLQLTTKFIDTKEAYGRTISSDARAPSSVPPKDLSHVDGYAVRSEELSAASEERPVFLRVVGKVGPWEAPSLSLQKGECWRVLTGAFIPEGSDAVIMQEDVLSKEDTIVVTEPINRGDSIVPEGSDVKIGDVLCRRGHTLGSQDIGLLTALRIEKVEVFARPRAAILSVGSELTEELDEKDVRKVVNSHLHVIANLVSEAGGEPIRLGIAPDDVKVIEPLLRKGLQNADMVSTIGGSSVGPADLVSECINSLGPPGVLVHGLKVQPARVAGFGVAKGKPVFILPGLIQSAVNGYAFLQYPLMRYLQGKEARRYSFSVKAVLECDVRFKSFLDFRHVTWVTLKWDKDGYTARPNLGDSSLMSLIARSHGYMVTPEERDVVPKGEVVDVNFLPGISSLSDIPWKTKGLVKE